jgi:thiamine transport system permease protein
MAFIVSDRITKGTVGIEQVDEGGNKPRVDKRDWLAVVVTGAIIVGLIGWPIAQVIAKSFSFDGVLSMQNFENLSTRGERDLLNITVLDAAVNSLRNAAIATVISIVLGTLVAYLLSRPAVTKIAKLSNRTLDALFLLPMGVSSVVLGFGYLVTFGGGPLPLRSSWLVVPLVQALMALPLVIRLVYPALLSIGSEHREAAETEGASAGQIWWQIEAPMIRGVLATATGYAAVVSIGEFGAASLLAYGNQATLPTILYSLISRPGAVNYGMAMAVCAILIALTLLLVFLVSVRGSNQTQRQP